MVPAQGLLVWALQCVLGLSSCSPQTCGESLGEEVLWLMMLGGSSSVVDMV